MKKESFQIGKIPAVLYGEESGRVFLFLHGQGGNKEEAGAFAAVAAPLGFQVLGIDLPGHGARADEAARFCPWCVVPELRGVMDFVRGRWEEVSLRANSIGAQFSMQALAGEKLGRCLFVSPVVDMRRLIENMMRWAEVSEERLAREGVIPTSFGNDLSWEYYSYVKEHPITRWDAPTAILYGEGDHLVERAAAEGFAERFGCGFTMMPGGEHWFHTPEQLAFLAAWEKEQLAGMHR